MAQKTVITPLNLSEPSFRRSTHELPREQYSFNPTIETQSYYRSRMLFASVHANALIACAEPLLFFNNKLKNSVDCQNIGELYHFLVHEIKAFEVKAQDVDYRLEIIVVARYILSALLDETIAHLPWAKINGWQKNQLLHTFQSDDDPDERFFLLLDRLLKEPKYNLDLLELFYLCLSFGFEGKYHQLPRGKHDLDILRDDIYQHIMLFRNFDPYLFQASDFSQTKPTTVKNITAPLGWLALTFPFIIIFLFCFELNSNFAFKTEGLKNQTHEIQQTLNHYE